MNRLRKIFFVIYGLIIVITIVVCVNYIILPKDANVAIEQETKQTDKEKKYITIEDYDYAPFDREDWTFDPADWSFDDINEAGLIFHVVFLQNFDEDIPITENLVECFKNNGWYKHPEKFFEGVDKENLSYRIFIGAPNLDEYDKGIVKQRIKVENHLVYDYKYNFKLNDENKLDYISYIGKELFKDEREQNLYHMDEKNWEYCLSHIIGSETDMYELYKKCAISDKYIGKYGYGKTFIKRNGLVPNRCVFDLEVSSYNDNYCMVGIEFIDNKLYDKKEYGLYRIDFQYDDNFYLEDAKYTYIKPLSGNEDLSLIIKKSNEYSKRKKK